MTVAAASPHDAIERSTRRALGWGGGLLVLGLAAVGVGRADEGAPLALAGLLITIFGIHRFGRLGPNEPELQGAPPPEPDTLDRAVLRAEAVDAMWSGGLAAVAGLAITLGSYFATTASPGGGRFLLAYGAIVGGGIRFARGYQRSQEATQLSITKTAALPTEDADEQDRPRPRRKRARRRDAQT